MIFSSQPRPCIEDGLEAARRQRLQRTGLRLEPRGGEPTGAFVAIEMAVLVIVFALAMASVIVTTCSPAEARAVVVGTGSAAARPHGPDAGATRFTRPATRNVARPAASGAATR